jgi:hypothetical protein
MADLNPDIVNAAARATIQAQTQTAIGLNIPVFFRGIITLYQSQTTNSKSK